MTPVFLSDSFWLHFGTASATTGGATNADSTPVVTIAEDGTDLGYAPTVTNVDVGLYKVQIDATAGNGFESGRRYSCYAAATVGAVTGRDGIGEFEVLAVDMNTGVASVTGAVASVTGLTPANLDVAVSSRMATFTLPTNFSALSISAAGLVDVLQSAADKVWATAVRLLTAGTNIVLAKGVGVTGFNDIAATAIVSAGAITTSGGKVSGVILTDTLTTYTGNTVQTGDSFARLGAPIGASISADIASVQSDTDNIQTRIPAALVAGRMDSSVGAIAAGAIDAAAIATDAFGSAELGADAANEIADAVLDRNMGTGADSGSPTVRTTRQALRFLRNKWDIAAGTLTVYKEDDVTASWTSTITTTAGDPVSKSDPPNV